MNLFGSPNIERMAAEHDHDGLYKCLENDNPATRLEAALALAEMNDGAGWRFLMDSVRQTDDVGIQETAAAMLGELGHPRAVPTLGQALIKAKGETADTIRQALEAIGGAEADEALRKAGYEPVLPKMASSQQVIEYDSHYVHQAITPSDTIQFHTAEEHLNTAIDLREAEITERGLVEDSLALWLNPTWAYAWYLRGVLFEDLERSGEALLAYRHAVELDPLLKDARDALDELAKESITVQEDPDLLLSDLTAREWASRRDAAAGIGDLALRGDPRTRAAVDSLIELLQDEDREVRHAAVEALGRLDDRRAVLPLLEMEESSWLVRFAILQSLAQLGSVEGLSTVLRREMNRIQERNPIFTSHKDPLLEVEYDTLMEIGVRAFERTGDIESLLFLAENNAWETVDEGTDEERFGEEDIDQDELDAEAVDEDLTSYVDEVAEMSSLALERLATPQLPQLSADLLERLAVVPDLTLLDVTDENEEAVAQPAVVHDLSALRQAAKEELERRKGQ